CPTRRSSDLAEALLGVLLDDLLQAGLVVGLGVLALGDEAQDELPGHLHPAVQVEGGDEGLEGVRDHAGPLPAAAALLPLAQAEVVPQVDLLGELEQRPLADQAGPDAGQVPLRAVGVGVEQVVGRDDLQHAVAQELQPFVVGHRDAALVGIAGVGQGRGQQAGVLEGVADDLFKRMRHGCYALLSGQFSVWLAWAAAALAAATSSRAACMVPHRSFSTQIFAWRMAFLMALALDEPWALMTGCRAPRKGAPPYSSLSICFFSSATLPFIIRPASLPVVL